MRSGIALVMLVLVACGGAATKAASPAPARTAITTADVADAGVLALCSPEAKDAAPCVEECNRGIATSCEELADRLETARGVPRDPTRAAALHERACDLREASGCLAAARMYGAGRGVVPSRPHQIDLLAAACDLGDASACVTAARAFEQGSGVPANEARARTLWQRACLNGDRESCDDDEPR